MGFFDIQPFIDKNSERFMLSKRIGAVMNYLKDNYLITDREILTRFQFREGQYSENRLNDGEWTDFEAGKDLWGGKEEYCWFRQIAVIPDRMKGKDVYYSLSASEDGNWTRTTRPQFILFVDGTPVSGMDENHSSIKIASAVKGGEKLKIHINAYSDDFGYKGRMFLSAQLQTIDKDVKRLYWHFKTILDVANLLGPDDENRIKLISGLTEAANIVNLTLPYGGEFIISVKEASKYIEENILGSSSKDAYVSAIGHTHIDVAWLWRLRQTRDKAARTFASMNKLMNEYPDFKFISSQAQLYDFVKKDYPDIYESIKKRVREGKWEVEGGMWVEADTNISSGESLIRQFLVGKRFFKKEFDKNCEILWLPDVFGYSGALPQIMNGCGIKYFMTTKISWNEYTKVPYDTFVWEGIDGTGILSHFVPSQSYGDETKGNFMTTYNSNLSPSQVMGGWQRFSNKDLSNNILNCYGHGDGGGGTDEGMIEQGLRMRAGIPGCPKVKFEFAGDFFRNLERQVKGSKRLNKWRGELYLEYHRGTLTAQAINKRFNRKSEFMYQDAESVNVLSSLLLDNGFERYPKTGLDNGWETILLNQFHDIIPGSSIAPVYEDSKEQYIKILTDGEYIVSTALERIANSLNTNRNCITVFNTLGFERSSTATLNKFTDINSYEITDENGNILPKQETFDGKVIFYAENIPSKGYKAFNIINRTENLTAEKTAEISGNSVKTKYFDLIFSDNMEIIGMYCKNTKREAVPKGKVMNRIIAFEERPYQDHNWNTNAYFEEKSEIISNVINARVLENGPVRAVLLITRAFKSSVIKQYIILYNHTDRIDILNDIDWKESCMIVKAEFPVDVNAEKATYDIQFGNIERPTHSNTLGDFAKFEASAHKWADLSDNSFGISVLNDCKYGYNIKDGKIRLSLLRSQDHPKKAQDQERHIFTYSVYPHQGFVSQSDVVRQGYDLNVPLLSSVAAGKGSLPSEFSLFSTNADNIIIETVKKAEDSDAVIIRMYETWNKRTNCTLNTGLKIQSLFGTNMMEEKDFVIPHTDNSAELEFRPFEIKTLKIFFE